MIENIFKQIWELSPESNKSQSYSKLVELTKELINIYKSQGRLTANPLNEAKKRTLHLPLNKINEELKNSTCIVTGGLGLVGSNLVWELTKFDVKLIVVVDIKDKSDYNTSADSRIINIKCDVRDFDSLKNIFLKYEPNFVFHTAAERNPGYAETHIMNTVTTNILGTYNVVKACEKTKTVEQCIFSSTGKASRYYTKEIYAGTKKICEYIFDTFSKSSNINYSFVRFTHILENSLMNIELANCSQTEKYLKIHSPGKYVTAQNVKEAAYLLLNALLYSSKKQCNFLIVRHLEWPVESLEMALYYIDLCKRDIPVLFQGNPLGYSEKFFRGQLDWSNPTDLNLLINVYENRFKQLNDHKDIIISRICEVDKNKLEDFISKCQSIKNEEEAKELLITGLHGLVESSLLNVNKNDTVNILNWGLKKELLDAENAKASDFDYFVPLLINSLKGTDKLNQVQSVVEHLL